MTSEPWRERRRSGRSSLRSDVAILLSLNALLLLLFALWHVWHLDHYLDDRAAFERLTTQREVLTGYVPERMAARTLDLPRWEAGQRMIQSASPTAFRAIVGADRIVTANRAAIEGKSIVLVDDSLVRGTTSVKIVQMMRDAGAAEVRRGVEGHAAARAGGEGRDETEYHQVSPTTAWSMSRHLPKVGSVTTRASTSASSGTTA